MTRPFKLTTTLLFLLLSQQFSLRSFAEEIVFSQCTQASSKNFVFGAECGYMDVDLDHNNKSQNKIKIYVMRIPAISQSNKPPIFFIAGGPGQASTDLAKTFRYQFSQLLTEHDFIFVDQRGTGSSQALNCDIDPLKYAHLPSSLLEKAGIEMHKKCLDNYAVDPAFFLTTDAVKDLEKIRMSLSYPKIYLWGGSYGTRVIIEYLRQHKNSIEGAVLDGLAPVEIQLPNHSEYDTSQVLVKILSRCKSEAPCNNAFPNLEKRWLALLRDLEKDPVQIQIKHPRTEKNHEVFIDNVTISNWVRAALYSRELSALLPLAMSKAIERDFSKLYSMQALGFEGIEKNISEGMQFSILCAEDRQYAQKHSATEHNAKRLLNISATESFNKICELFPESRAPEEYFRPTTSSVPTLLLSGDLDPATPPRWADSVKQTLSNSKHIVAPGGHHIISPLGCIPQIIEKFFESPNTVKDIDIHCADRIKPLDFFIDSAGPKLYTQEQEQKGNTP